MIESILRVLAQQWHLIVPVALLAYLASNYYGKGLHKYPGPLLARFTNIWRFVDVWNRRPDITQIDLHRKHGDVVRLGPKTLSFSDPAAIKTIYGLNKGFVKVCTFTHFGNQADQVSLASIRHSKLCLRANVCHLFSRLPMKLTMLLFDDQSTMPSR